jgi:DNA repair exonuclease SbcCD nuclease subunit
MDNPGAPERGRLTLVHTSDVHLGCDFAPTGLPERAFSAVVDLALELAADALLLPGDVVDYNRVPEQTLEFILAELARFGRPVFVLPGNHDCYDESSIYHRPAWARRSANVHLVNSTDGPDCIVPELCLEVWGRPVVRHWRKFRPLDDMPPRSNGRWRIALAHGHLELPGEDERSSPIFPEHIAAAQCDYIALGHWDRQIDVSQGDVVAHYSGAPHGPRGLTSALVVTLDPHDGTRVRSVPLREPPEVA